MMMSLNVCQTTRLLLVHYAKYLSLIHLNDLKEMMMAIEKS